MINVTKTFLPPISEYTQILNKAWDAGWITNRGALITELEAKLKSFLDVGYLTIMNNGTMPLQIALKLLATKKEIITTPFSYVATTSSILWEGFRPVFVDIEEPYLTIDAKKIEGAITENTSAILATHVFGNPCDISEISRLAKKYNLKVIFDAAHCFGVQYEGSSIFNFGDISTCSFHATKLFHTGEGGAIFTSDRELADKIFYSHNFGHNGPLDFHGVGINAKISELQAAMGLAVFPYIQQIIKERKFLVELYLEKLNAKYLRFLSIREGTVWNYSYFPIIFESEETLLRVIDRLNKANIFPRRYFYPSLNTINFIDGKAMPVSESVASRIACLPLYNGLTEGELNSIVSIINIEWN